MTARAEFGQRAIPLEDERFFHASPSGCGYVPIVARGVSAVRVSERRRDAGGRAYRVCVRSVHRIALRLRTATRFLHTGSAQPHGSGRSTPGAEDGGIRVRKWMKAHPRATSMILRVVAIPITRLHVICVNVPPMRRIRIGAIGLGVSTVARAL